MTPDAMKGMCSAFGLTNAQAIDMIQHAVSTVVLEMAWPQKATRKVVTFVEARVAQVLGEMTETPETDWRVVASYDSGFRNLAVLAEFRGDR